MFYTGGAPGATTGPGGHGCVNNNREGSESYVGEVGLGPGFQTDHGDDLQLGGANKRTESVSIEAVQQWGSEFRGAPGNWWAIPSRLNQDYGRKVNNVLVPLKRQDCHGTPISTFRYLCKDFSLSLERQQQ